MITVKDSAKSINLMLEFMNTMRKTPVSLDDYRKRNLIRVPYRFIYSNSVGGFVPFNNDMGESIISREINSFEIKKILDEELQ